MVLSLPDGLKPDGRKNRYVQTLCNVDINKIIVYQERVVLGKFCSYVSDLGATSWCAIRQNAECLRRDGPGWDIQIYETFFFAVGMTATCQPSYLACPTSLREERALPRKPLLLFPYQHSTHMYTYKKKIRCSTSTPPRTTWNFSSAAPSL